MSSRHPPPGESHYTPSRDRDRSPYRLERRGSINSGPVRYSDNSYRPADSNANSRDVLGAPRGPSGRGTSYPPRGGTYIGRETRGGREGGAQFYRRDSERDFSRRDNDRRISPSRNRSRTPPTTRDFRDVRDNRDTPLRSLDMTRVTRDARENGPLSAVSVASSEGVGSGSNYHRNSFRSNNRGRGDHRDRGPARRNFDERDSFRPRSRSRDRWDRDHDRGRDHDRDTRRDEDVRDRDSDRPRRDPPPVRPDSRNSVTSQPTSVGGTIHVERRDPTPRQPSFPADTPRRTSFVQTSGRPDLPRLSSTNAQTPSSPLHYPQVPEFGLAKPITASAETSKSVPLPSPKEETNINFKNDGIADPIKIAPRGPKADLALQQPPPPPPPIAPKSFGRRLDQSPASRRFDAGHDVASTASPVAPRFGPSASPPFANLSLNRPRNQTWTIDQAIKTGHGSVANQEIRVQHENDSQRPADIKIPTGPKADRDSSVWTPLSARTNKPAALIWNNPNRQLPSQHKPSIMQSLHGKKDDENVSQPLASSPGLDTRSAKVVDAENMARRASADMPMPRRSILSPGYPPSAIQGLRKDTDEDENADTMDDEDEDDEDDEEEDNAELDQQDFEKAEARFKKQIESLRSKLVPEPSRNPKILAALESIDIYASAIEDYKNGYVPPPEPVGKDKLKGTAVLSPTLSTRPAEIPTPPAEITQVKDEDEKDHIKQVVMTDLPLDGLIYLDKNRLTPASFSFEDTEAEEDELCDRVRHTLALDRSEDDQFRDHYAELYFRWREEVDTMDEENAQQEALATRAATPMSVVGTETATTPVPESGRRSARNATEMDLERVIKESAEEAQAAEMAQVPVDMSVEPDMTREAEIPDMLTEADQKTFVFEDINNRVPNVSDIMVAVAPEDNPVFKALDYLPLPDDFDLDDQERFMDAYAKFPKQWGALARNMNEAASQTETKDESQLPPKRRDYHQCILHYYMTKKQAKPAYKLLPNRKRMKKKTGPGGRRGNQRSSMLGGGEDGGVRMTDTGRPKRAAAPNFNDKEKRDAEVLAQKAAIKEKKASTLLNKPTADGASGTGKVGRGGRKKVEKGMKRGPKAAQLAPNGPTGQMVEETGADLAMQNAYGSRDLEGAQLLAELHGYAGHSSNVSQSSPQFPKGSQNETWRIDPRAQVLNQQSQVLGAMSALQQPAGVSTLDIGVTPRGLSASTQENVFSVRQPSPQVAGQSGGTGNNHISNPSDHQTKGPNSYWTVPERNKFEECVKAYGKDWRSIAERIPTKTETMVENFFKKGGKNTHDPTAKQKMEEIALEAEARNRQYGPPAPVLPLAQSTSSGNGGGRRRGAPATNRTLAPNPEPVPQSIMPAGTLPDTHVVPSPAHVQAQAQEQSQSTSHPRIAPARPVVSPAASVTEIAPPTRVPLSPQTARSQAGITQSQYQSAPYAANSELDRPRNVAPVLNESINSLQMLQSKRPRSISEQDLHNQEQPPKRQQSLASEEFTQKELTEQEFAKLMMIKHEQEQQQRHQPKMQHVMPQQQPLIPPQQQYAQQQQRPPPQLQSQAPLQQPLPQQQQYHQQAIHRSDSQKGYDYRPPPPATMATYSQPIRTAPSGPEQFDRYRRAPSPSQYHKEREAYAPQHHRQEMASNVNSMATAISASRSFDSPRQHAPAELPRPSSIAPLPSAAPSRSTPAPPQKKSNIMSLLNNDDPPEEKKVADNRPAIPARHDSQATNTSMHHSTQQPVYQRREAVDPARDSHNQRGFSQPVYATPATQPQSYSQPNQPYVHASQHQHQTRESYQQHRPYYPEAGRPPVYQQAPSAVSPPPAQQSAYHPPRSTYDVPSHAHMAPPTSHSRGSSSFSMHANSSGAIPGGALEPSPYASIRPPLGPSQNISHHPPSSSSQHPGYHPADRGPLTMTGPSRAANAIPGQLAHEQHRRVEEQSGIPRYGTPPSHTPPNNSRYGNYAPPPHPPV